MAPSGLRFRPPPLELDPAVRWVLLRAFVDSVQAPAPDPSLALARARALGLAARVGARTSRERLTAELGGGGAAEFLAATRSAAARALQLEGLRQAVATVADARGIPLVLLKFGALEAAGRIAPGSRAASDLDLLVAGARAPELIAALHGAGFTTGDEPEQEHQWPTLFRNGVALELHRHLPGIVVPSRRSGFATLEDLVATDALVAVAPGLFRPTEEVLAAHLLAHGLAQHGLTPEGYPALRLFADLSDLGLGAADETRWNAVSGWLSQALSPREIAAARALLRALEAGRLDELGGDDALLLAHLLAGALDPTYRQALKLRLFAPPLSERGRGAAFGAFLGRTVWLSDAQIDAIYGRPKTRLGYTARRLARPVDLAVRSVRSLVAALRRHR